ncbi:activated cdc42 kinase 1-like [Plakobranchus ocellatus]|uniref:Activated cdc42 kinase 1-like n=1 Tax=Plakobranchus ocellatus TaxID=259542 RepID=A0AAV4BRU1_9GAST|nr:activated cdc42 kinase 1-like [Plakobranchus ocellatus]
MAGYKCVILLLCLTFTTAQAAKGKTWALLAASANGWGNYGMQADVYHAYQVIKKGGIPDEQIIVMAYDDIAQNSLNPFKGKVFHSYDMMDVYKGVNIDYSGKSVTKEIFLAALRGDKEGVKNLTGREGKVIDSGPNDNIFVYISDHGGPGIVCWLDGNDLTAKELNKTITTMHQNKRYKHMVLYIDTCNAGSMFKNILPNDIGVYAVTATTATEPAFSVECNSQYFSDLSWTCLGGLFSINWVYETESDERTSATLEQQFKEAKIACEKFSVPKQYGNHSIARLAQSKFFGDSALKPKLRRRLRRSTKNMQAIPKHMQAYYLLQNRLVGLPNGSPEHETVAKDITRYETLMDQVDSFMEAIPYTIDASFQTNENVEWRKRNFGDIDWKCYEPVIESVKTKCPGIWYNEEAKYYALSQFGILINLCNEVPVEKLRAAITCAADINPLCKL